MNKLSTLILIVVSALSIASCGSKVEIPPAHVGKVLTQNGYAPKTLPPSKFRLPACFAYCDKLVLLSVADTGFKENMKLFMPQDKLNLDIEVRGTLSIPSDTFATDALYSKLVAETTDNSAISQISTAMVYNTYGQQALRGVVRSEIVKYTIPEILSNREVISQNIHAALIKKLKETNTPLLVSRFELASIQPPPVIVAAQEAAKEREIDIQKANADAEVDLVRASRQLEVAKKDRLVERERAEAIAEQNKIAAASISKELLAYRRLEVAERIWAKLAESDNVLVVPGDASSFSSVSDDAVLAKMLGKELNK